jgi:hypothetical protein
MEKDYLHAVHDDDLKKLVENLGLLKDLQDGKIKCKFCRDTITFDNLNTMFSESGAIKVICNKPECEEKLTSYLTKKE